MNNIDTSKFVEISYIFIQQINNLNDKSLPTKWKCTKVIQNWHCLLRRLAVLT